MPKASSLDARRRAAIAWGIVTLAILAGTLAPFRFKRTPSDWFWHFYVLSDVVLNVIMFFPFGFCAVLALPKPRSPVLRVILVTMIAVVLSAGIENAQRYEPARMGTVPDIVADVIGAMAGAYVASRYASAY